MKRVLFIQPDLGGGGAEKVLIDILRNFDFNQYEVSLLLLRREGIYLPQIPGQVRVYSPADLWNKTPKLLRFKFLRSLMRKLSIHRCFKKSYDTIISFMEGEAVKFHSRVTSKGRRNLSWIHTDLSHFHWSKQWFENTDREIEAYRKFDEIICVSDSAATGFSKMIDPGLQVTVIPNIIDGKLIAEKACQPADLPGKNGLTLCCVGRLSDPKRQDRLIEALAILHSVYSIKANLWLLGEGPDQEKLEKLADDLGMKKYVHFLGFRPNPYPYMKAADIFILPSDAEGWPLVLGEALALGKPVVATDVSGNRDILNNGGGILVKPDASELSKAVARLVSEPGLLQKTTAEASEAAKKLDTSLTMNKIYSLITPSN